MFHTEGKTGPGCHTGTDGTVTLEPCPAPQGLPELMSLAESVRLQSNSLSRGRYPGTAQRIHPGKTEPSERSQSGSAAFWDQLQVSQMAQDNCWAVLVSMLGQHSCWVTVNPQTRLQKTSGGQRVFINSLIQTGGS